MEQYTYSDQGPKCASCARAMRRKISGFAVCNRSADVFRKLTANPTPKADSSSGAFELADMYDPTRLTYVSPDLVQARKKKVAMSSNERMFHVSPGGAHSEGSAHALRLTGPDPLARLLQPLRLSCRIFW